MATILVAIIIVGATTAVSLLLLFIHNKQKRKHMTQLLHRFSQLGSLYNLSFSSQEVSRNTVLGLDGVQGKLLFLSKLDEKVYTHSLVDLRKVKACSVKKIYTNIQGGALVNGKLDHHLQSIVLLFEMNNMEPPTEVCFYNHVHDSIYHVKEQEAKANDWETILSKMLKTPLAKQMQ
jgi:hypothetical protein